MIFAPTFKKKLLKKLKKNYVKQVQPIIAFLTQPTSKKNYKRNLSFEPSKSDYPLFVFELMI